MSPNRWALLYRTDIGASGGRFSKNSLCLKAAVWIQPRPHCRRRGRFEGAKGRGVGRRREEAQVASEIEEDFFLLWQFLMKLKFVYYEKATKFFENFVKAM